MYSIGAFAQLGGVSVRRLRHYAGLGLLVPVRVDPVTGHRFYEASQLPRLNRLVALKDLGFSLEQVGRLLDDGISVAELGTMLRLRAAELEKRLLHDRQTLDRVRGRLRLIEGENAVPITDIEVKHAAAQRVLCLHTAATAPGGKHVEPLFEQVIERMDAVGADRASPISWHQRHDDRAELVFAGYVAPIEEVPGLETVVLPATSVASVVRRGTVDGIDEAHRVLAHWAQTQGLVQTVEAGRWREVYLETDDDDYSEWLIEVQLELSGSDDS